MNNIIRTFILVYVIIFLLIALFSIPCKRFFYNNEKTVFVGERITMSIFELLNSEIISDNKRDIYYIDWQVLWLELMSLTIFFIGASLIFKE